MFVCVLICHVLHVSYSVLVFTSPKSVGMFCFLSFLLEEYLHVVQLGGC